MRISRNILMETNDKPVGGKWNYDSENRIFEKSHVASWNWKNQEIKYINEAKEYFGAKEVEFSLPVTRADALSLLEYFIVYHFRDFGRLEDAMYTLDTQVHHSMLSTALNF